MLPPTPPPSSQLTTAPTSRRRRLCLCHHHPVTSVADAMYARPAKGVMFDVVWRSGGHLWSMLADNLDTKKQWIR